MSHALNTTETAKPEPAREDQQAGDELMGVALVNQAKVFEIAPEGASVGVAAVDRDDRECGDVQGPSGPVRNQQLPQAHGIELRRRDRAALARRGDGE